MMFRTAAGTIVVLMVTMALAQGASPAAGPAAMSRRSPMARSPYPASNRTNNMSPTALMHQRMDEMQTTLDKMHALLKQMRAKEAKNSSKDQLAKANLEMWDLMVGQLDKQFEDLRMATTAREQFEARRAAMYKQADAKAEAAAQAARAAQAAKFAGQAPAAGPSTTGQAPASQTSPAPPEKAAPSPK